VALWAQAGARQDDATVDRDLRPGRSICNAMQLQDFGADRRRLLYGARNGCSMRRVLDRCPLSRSSFWSSKSSHSGDAGYPGPRPTDGGRHVSVYTVLGCLVQLFNNGQNTHSHSPTQHKNTCVYVLYSILHNIDIVIKKGENKIMLCRDFR
jgi:hypothetical protein